MRTIDDAATTSPPPNAASPTSCCAEPQARRLRHRRRGRPRGPTRAARPSCASRPSSASTGFVGLQADVQDELVQPAPPRRRSDPRGARRPMWSAARHGDRARQRARPRSTRVDRDVVRPAAVGSSPIASGHVCVLPGDALARLRRCCFADDLGDAARRRPPPRRPATSGPGAPPRRRLRRGDALVALDFRRYERWVVSTADRAADAGARVVALTDSALSPLADRRRRHVRRPGQRDQARSTATSARSRSSTLLVDRRSPCGACVALPPTGSTGSKRPGATASLDRTS